MKRQAINYLVEAIKPSADRAKGMSVDILNNSIDVNTRDIAAQLGSTKPRLYEAVKDGKLKIVGARYHLDTGRVDMLE